MDIGGWSGITGFKISGVCAAYNVKFDDDDYAIPETVRRLPLLRWQGLIVEKVQLQLDEEGIYRRIGIFWSPLHRHTIAEWMDDEFMSKILLI